MIRVKVADLGVMDFSDFELGKLTMICGKNNTGKTYVTHAVYGFLRFAHNGFLAPISPQWIEQLVKTGSLSVNATQEYFDKCLEKACKEYSATLANVFASDEKRFKSSRFEVTADMNPVKAVSWDGSITSGTSTVRLCITASTDGKILGVTLTKESPAAVVSHEMISRLLGQFFRVALFDRVFPTAIMSSTERSGACMFQRELDFRRSRMLEIIADKSEKVSVQALLSASRNAYPSAVRDNIDFVRGLPDFQKRDSFLVTKHKEVLEFFRAIVGGEYVLAKTGEVLFAPKSVKPTKLKLPVSEWSSSVRSLMDVWFYLRHLAQPGSMLMIDEPEMNLHPENQRLLARLFARLVNLGVHVFVTTHSDFFVKEMNTLLTLNRPKKYLRKIAEENGYTPEELLKCEDLRVYSAQKDKDPRLSAKSKTRFQTLVPADIQQDLGIEIKDFDSSIDAMNIIQSDIIWGSDEDE